MTDPFTQSSKRSPAGWILIAPVLPIGLVDDGVSQTSLSGALLEVVHRSMYLHRVSLRLREAPEDE